MCRAARQRNLEIVNLSGRLADSVSEFTIGLVIAEMRNIARSHEALRRGEWGKDESSFRPAFELAGQNDRTHWLRRNRQESGEEAFWI